MPGWYYTRGTERVGPLELDALKQLLATGQVSSTEMVWTEGMTEWVPATGVAALAGSVPVARPQMFMPPPVRPDIGQDAGMRMLLPVGRSGWAIAAGYLGLFALLIMPAPIALIISIIAIIDIRRHPEKHGMGRAIFGLVMGILGTLMLGFMVVAILTGK